MLIERFGINNMKNQNYQICNQCVMDTSDSLIKFDSNGLCDHCINFQKNIKPNWKTGNIAKSKLDKIINIIKKDGKNKEFDCIIGISGGIDSSYLLYYAKEVLGLRPLAFSVDTGWNLNVAVENIEKVVRGLNMDLSTEIINWSEMKDLQLSFFKSQVPYQDIPQDHIIFSALYNFAVKNKIKHVLTGGNFSTECIREPLEWVYQNDLKMIKDIHKRFGNKPLKSLPMTSMFKYKIFYRFFKGMRVHRILDLIPYKKNDAIDTLKLKFDYEPYPNKHFESIFTRFYEGYWLIEKFGYDKRRAHFSSLILTDQLSRETALSILELPPYEKFKARQDLDYICKKLGIPNDEFLKLMNMENKNYRDYKNSSSLISFAVKIAQFLGIENRQYR
jgi:N-acetyl sugar amidotransferase